MAMGRPTKLTPAVQENICQAIRSSAPIHWAFRYAGVSDQTLRNWRKAADHALTKPSRSRSTHERKCIDFFVAVERAEADSFMMLNSLIATGAQKSVLVKTEYRTTPDGAETIVRTEQEVAGEWRAAAHIAARRFPKDMGDRTSLEVTGAEGGPVKIVSAEEAFEELEAVRREKAAQRVSESV